MHLAEQIYDRLLDLLGLLSGVLICLLTLGIGFDVVSRNIGIGTVPGSVEVSEHIIYAVTFLGAPWVLRLGAHIRIDLVVTALPVRIARMFEVAADIAGLAVSALLLYYGMAVVIASYANGNRVYQFLIYPEWWVLWEIPFAGALMMIEFVRRIVRVHARRAPLDPASRPGL